MSFYNQFTQLVHDFLISFIFGFIHFINGSTSTIICNRKIKKDSIVLENIDIRFHSRTKRNWLIIR